MDGGSNLGKTDDKNREIIIRKCVILRREIFPTLVNNGILLAS